MIAVLQPVLLCLALLFTAVAGPDALAQSAKLEGVFCQTSPSVDAKTCTPAPIHLPHSWSPERPGIGLGHYRFELERPAPGDYALRIERLSLDGRVSVQGQTVIDHLSDGAVTRQRYWPLIGRFHVAPGSSGPLIVEATVRGHSATKNGIGRITLAPLAIAEAAHRRDLIVEVVAFAAVATGALLAGLMGLLGADQDGRAARILISASWLSINAGLRCLHNLVTDPLIEPAIWLALGNFLLALMALQAVRIVHEEVAPERQLSRTYLILTLLLACLMSGSAFLSWGKVISDGAFAALSLAGLVLLIRHSIKLLRSPDSIGLAILAAVGLILATGVHDLLLNLGANTLSDLYLQTWALPLVVILSVLTLARRNADHRQLERALQRADARREDLVRDLHDRIGSRLVALSFHARQNASNARLVEEIHSLIHDVRMIHTAVSADATTLEALLADLRHLYARIGGGRLPLEWRLSDLSEPVSLDPEQALAVIRMIEEAVANALKHADPSRILIRLSRGEGTDIAILDVADDGRGELQPASSGGGLNNIRLRAMQAGVQVEFLRGEGSESPFKADGLPSMKAVRMRFPRPRKARSGSGLFRLSRLGEGAVRR